MKKIGFIGAGNMATAIINGLIAQKGSAGVSARTYLPQAARS